MHPREGGPQGSPFSFCAVAIFGAWRRSPGLLEWPYDRQLVEPSRSPRRARSRISKALGTRRIRAREQQWECGPQYLHLAGRRLDTRRSGPRRNDAAIERRPLRRRPVRALGSADFGERLLRPRRLADKLRCAFLPRSRRQSHSRLLARGATSCCRSRNRRQNSSSPAGLRDYRRESRVWRLRAASRFRRAHRGLVKRRCGQRAGGLGGSCHRHGHRRIGARTGRALRAGRLSRHTRSRQLARRCSSCGIL